MLNEKQIKIIKQAERNNPPADKRSTRVHSHLEETKRDAVTIVTGWIKELRRKKDEEAAHGFESLFGKAG